MSLPPMLSGIGASFRRAPGRPQGDMFDGGVVAGMAAQPVDHAAQQIAQHGRLADRLSGGAQIVAAAQRLACPEIAFEQAKTVVSRAQTFPLAWGQDLHRPPQIAVIYPVRVVEVVALARAVRPLARDLAEGL